ncbi:MAG TPA: 6-phosphogluconolactonase [Opitutae bacterium]|nr:6-phosphogluconolactonase [Opitutae bacterium]|tara:strand:+ start:452 stop:1186 length:735 start_codon:yes stop_codon:yes gene_type:complete
MKHIDTHYGQVRLGTDEEIYASMLGFIEDAVLSRSRDLATIGLSGGSTPKAFYRWCIEEDTVSSLLAAQCLWATSDERDVPIGSEESNFGSAKRMFLDYLNIPKKTHYWPWPTILEPQEAAKNFNHQWEEHCGRDVCFDLCFLGMGPDCHTASLFPGCPLIGSGLEDNFAATEWPGRGWRLTITEAGLMRSKRIVIAVTGASKAEALHAVLHGDFNPKEKPAQVLKPMAEHVVWLVDETAGSQL